MTASRVDVEVPQAGADRVAMGRFAHMLGTQMPTWDAPAARSVAAALARAHASRESEAEAGVLFGLLLAVRGVADKLDHIAQTAALSAHEPAKLRVLEFVRFSRNARPVEVAREVKLTTHYASRLLKSMVDEGLLAKLGRGESGDGRASVYALTPWGQEQLDRARRGGEVGSDMNDAEVRANQVGMLRDDLIIEQEARRAGGSDVAVARKHLEAMARLAADLGEPDLEVDILSELSTALRQAGQADDARALVEERFDTPTFATDRGVLRRSYENAKLEMLTPRPDFAHVKDLLASARSLAPTSDPLSVWIDLTDSDRARLEGNFVASLNIAHRALHQARETGHAFSHIKAGVQIALIARTAGLRSERPLLERVLENAETSGYGVLAAECRLQLGELHRALGRQNEAYTLLFEAEQALGSHSSGRAAAFAASAVAACAYEQAHAASDSPRIDVQKKLLFALQLADDAGAADAQALTLRRLGVVASDLGENADAVRYLELARELYATSNRRSVVGELECQAALAALTTTRSATRAAVNASVLLLDVLADRALNVVDEPDTPASILEPWVLRGLVESAEQADQPEVVDRIHAQHQKLRDAKFVGARTQKAITTMGREPVLI